MTAFVQEDGNLLDILESHCVAEGLDFRRLDGNTKSQERMKIVREFNSSPDINICLLSTMAGGLGLNFVGANVVVLFDPTWNPANDLQAIDRAYRIGQWRDVSVFRLITLGSSSVVGNQHARRYFEAVQGSDSHKGELFGIRNLFRLQTHGTCLTRQILEREGRVEAGVLTARTRTGTQETAPEEQTGSAGNSIAVSGDGGGAESGAGPASGSGEESGVSGGVLDFSGDEEEYGGEEKWGGRRKRPGGPTPNSSPAGLSLFQHGFAKLLQGGGGDTGGASDSEDDGRGGESDGDPPMDPETTAPPLQRHGWTVSSESDEGGKGAGGISAVTKNTPPSHAHCLSSGKGVGSRDITGQGKPKAWRRKADNRGNVACEADYDTDESGDIQLQPTCTNRRPCVRFGGVPDIRSFTSSSEDEPSPKKRKAVAMTERTNGGDGAFTALKSWTLAPPPSPSSNQRARPRQGVTIDKLLDGVTEVAYMHSNQSVVGSSKAEDRISRAALRDVFERRKYSQVPANELLDSSEHPVTHTVRATHRTRNAIVIMGGTPSAICRTQLEEMAAFFKVESVRDFAQDLLRSDSASRQTRLREFYHHQNPNLGPALDQMLPEPAPKPAGRASRPSCSSSSAVYPQRRKPGSKSSRPLTGSDRKGEVMDPRPAEPPAGKGKVVWKEDSSFQRFRPPSKSKLDAEPMDRTASPTELPAVKHGVLGGHGSGFKGSQPATKSRLYTELQDPDLTEWPVRNVSVAVEGGLNSKTRGPPHPKNTTLPSERAGGITRSPFDDSPGPSAQSDRRSRAGSPSDCPSDGRRRSHLGLGETEWEKGVALKPKPRNEHEGSAPKSQKHLLMDLIGDTSVLDDLFRPRTRGGASKDTPLAQAQAPLPAQAPPTAPPQAGEETAKKNRRKDIWDILNEGDEESLNRLTDLSLAEQLFRRAEVSREAKKDAPVDESSRLWKKNDKFLWKR
ncbi:hypothetical protein JZ751_018881 [Albula glossodonta]|uniref:Helicase C-terminal domain-containing protein n=1 Tax=Albula glossodonta TaxID=121402 RepID=A0A8T2MZE7_9TELE|nr:hypothetical protein JZ751_018881 [Albula glossodonta]